MATYSYVHNQMEVVCGELKSISDNIHTMLMTLEEGATASMKDWDTIAKDAYSQAKIKWDNAAGAMQSQVGIAQKTLGTINDYYQSGEKYGVSLFEG